MHRMPNDNIVKCPCCGRHDRNKQVGNFRLSDNELLLIERFSCGCGAVWENWYERNEQGYWTLHQVEIEYTECIEKD